jgi:hypothetical protein
VGFCEGQCLRPPPPLPKTLHELKTRIREACAKSDYEILHNMWQEVKYRLDVAPATCGAQIELYLRQITVHKTS